MKIQADTVVAIDYTLRDDAGKVIDTSEGHDPLYYLHGHQNIVEGLESALAGKSVGDSVDVVVPPEKGYGTRDEKLVFDIPKEQLPKDLSPQIGMRLSMNGEHGQVIPVTITKVKLNTVQLDGNHELADKALHFSVSIKAVRKATKDELSHGHAHGADGHHHH
ncbi:MAG: hypothetical protein RJA70_2451 [Pseudomonadota bacterium]|jgi:FKBP-type peptidyl-prolyl cis-trans isomerase SlyD